MATPESVSRLVVCDAGPLIHLDELGRVDLLTEFSEILVPNAVWEEVMRHRPGALAVEGVPFQKVAPSSPTQPDLNVLARTLPLQEGEREALQVAREQHADLLLTDDTAARLAGRTLGVPAHGTIGILFRAIPLGRMTGPEVAALLKSLPAISTLHIKRSLLEEFVRRAEQSSG